MRLRGKFTIQMLEETIEVYVLDKVFIPHSNGRAYAYGCYDGPNQICISRLTEGGKPLAYESMLATLGHELTHHILDKGQFLELFNNEVLVEWIGKNIAPILDKSILKQIKIESLNPCYTYIKDIPMC